MKSIEEKYENYHSQVHKERLPRVDASGEVVRELVTDESSESRNEFDTKQYVPTDIENYANHLVTLNHLAKLCSKIQLNMDDQIAIDALIKFVDNINSYVRTAPSFTPEEVADIENKLAVSLEILAKDAHRSGAMSKIIVLVEEKQKQYLQKILKKSLAGDQQALNQLQVMIKDDQLFDQTLKVLELLYTKLKKMKYNAQSDIVFNLFFGMKISSKIQDFVPNLSKYNRHNAKFRISNEVLGKNKKKDAFEQEKIMYEHQKEYKQAILIENQQGIMAILFVICSSVIKNFQRSILLQKSITIIKSFQPYLNTNIYEDIVAVCRQYLYGHFFERTEQYFQSLLALAGEETTVNIFQVKYNKAYSIINDVTYIRQKGKDEHLILYCDQPFEILMQCALLVTTIAGDCKAVLIWLLANIFRIREDNIGDVLFLFGRSMDGIDKSKAIAFYEKLQPIINCTKFTKFVENQQVRSSEARIAKLLGPEWD